MSRDPPAQGIPSHPCCSQLSLSPLCSVTPMSSSHVRSSDAYLLFYELASPSSRM